MERSARRRRAKRALAEAREAIEGRFVVVAERFLAGPCRAQLLPQIRGRGAADTGTRRATALRPIGRSARSSPVFDVNELLDNSWRAAGERAPQGTPPAAAPSRPTRTCTTAADAVRLGEGAGPGRCRPLGRSFAARQRRSKRRDRVLCGDGDGVNDPTRSFGSGEGTRPGAGWPYGAIFRLLLLTAQRESEVAGMRWAESRSRETRLDHPTRTHGNPTARTPCICRSWRREILSGALPRMGDLVFPSRAEGHPVASFAKPKQRLDAAMSKQAGAQIDAWVLHDLRRTATTIMARLKVLPHVADKILNHSAGTIRALPPSTTDLSTSRAQGRAGGAGALRRGLGAAVERRAAP